MSSNNQNKKSLDKFLQLSYNINMLKTYKFRIYPNKKQQTILNNTLSECRWTYNHLLEQRKTAWEQEKRSVSYYDQTISLVPFKVNRESLQNVHSQVLQNVAMRIDLAFKAFFRRVKAGEKPGFPRFRGKFRYDSFTYPQTGFSIEENKIKLSKIGSVKVKQHRQIDGILKTCTVRRTSTGKWFVSLACIVPVAPMPESKLVTGIDVGLESFATLSDGSKISNPRFFKQGEKSLARAQRKLSKQEKGTPKRQRARKVVARIHEHIVNKRHNFCHQTARQLVNKFGLIAVEDLNINKMKKDNFRCINKSIGDAAWRMFIDLLSCKAVEADREVIKVSPAYTSQDCSGCGYRKIKKLSERVHRCSNCGLILDRDHNAALNILALGMQSLAKA